MKVKSTRFRNLWQLIIVSVCTLAIFLTAWKIFTCKERAAAADFRLLAAISPEEIISLQKNRPQTWKDYLAVNEAVKIFTNDAPSGKKQANEAEAALKILHAQLDRKDKILR
jgi:hypothetical protein